MSRIGNKLVTIPAGVTVTEENGCAKVVGPKGTLLVPINHGISMKVEGNEIKFTRAKLVLTSTTLSLVLVRVIRNNSK